MSSHGSAFMQNKKIAGILKEAIDAPIGSTKRARAKKLVTVLRHVGASVPARNLPQQFDGQGGPGGAHYNASTPGSASFSTKAPRKDPDYSNMVIFPAPPAPRHGNPVPPGQTPGQNAQQGINYSAQNQQAAGGQTLDPTQAPQTPATIATPAQSNFNQYSDMPDIAQSFSNVNSPSPSSGGASNSSGGSSTPAQPITLDQISSAANSAITDNGKGGPGDNSSDPLDMGWTSLAASPNASALGGVSLSAPPSSPSQFSNLNLGSTNPAGLNSAFPSLTGSLSPAAPASNSYVAAAQKSSQKPSGLTGASSPTPASYTINGKTYTLNGSQLQEQTPSSMFSSLSGALAPKAQAQTPPATAPAAAAASTPATSPQGTPASTSPATGSTPDTGDSYYESQGFNPVTDTGDTTATPPAGASTPTVNGSLTDAVNNNMGATAWAQQTMANPDLLKQIFPNMTDLPASGSLMDAVKSLETTLQGQYNIPQLESQMLQMTADGATLGPMLQTYIQNKDQSLNAIHSQMQNAQNAMLHADTGNPYESAIWSRYTDYLNNLYTAQNESYADFYNKSIDTYQNSLTALNTALSTAMTQYNNQLQTDSTLTEADYNRTYQSLSDMYTAAQQAPEQELELATMQAQLAQAQAAVATSSSTTGQGDWAAEYSKLTNAGILFSNDSGDSNTPSTKGQLLGNVSNLTDAINTILSDNPKVGLDGAVYILSSAFQSTINSMGSKPDYTLPEAQKYTEMIIDAANQGVIPAASAQSMMQGLSTAVGKSLSSYVTDKNAPSVKDALVYALTGKTGSWFQFGATQPPSQAQLEKQFSSKLPVPLLDAIYQAASLNTAALGQGAAGQSTDQLLAQYATQIKNLPSSSAVGDYLSNMITSLYSGAASTSGLGGDSTASSSGNG